MSIDALRGNIAPMALSQPRRGGASKT